MDWGSYVDTFGCLVLFWHSVFVPCVLLRSSFNVIPNSVSKKISMKDSVQKIGKFQILDILPSKQCHFVLNWLEDE